MMAERWELRDSEGNVTGIVRDSKLNARSDYALYRDRAVRREYDGDGVCRVDVETRKHRLRREWELHEDGRQTLRYYWRRVRVPWIIWATFS